MKEIIPIETLLLKQIEDILLKREMKKSAFGKMACNDPKIVDRLREGRVITSATINALNRCIAELKIKTKVHD